MIQIPCFIGVLINLTLKEQSKNPSQLLAVPNFIRFKTKYTYSNNLKSTKIPPALVNSYHKDVSDTIQFILSYRKMMFVSLLTKENLSSCMLDY